MAVGIQMVILPFSKAGASLPHAGNTGFGVPEHHGNRSALPTLDQSGNLSLDLMQDRATWDCQNPQKGTILATARLSSGALT
jgi:hypothetical protein